VISVGNLKKKSRYNNKYEYDLLDKRGFLPPGSTNCGCYINLLWQSWRFESETWTRVLTTAAVLSLTLAVACTNLRCDVALALEDVRLTSELRIATCSITG